MLLPDKYTDFNTCVVNVAACVIIILNENGAKKYGEVLLSVQKMVGDSGKYVFKNALDFLFLLGKIEYFCESDMLELVK